MKKNDNEQGYSRRAFLETSIIGGAGIALGLGAVTILEGSTKDTVRLLTASGEIVEVDRRFLPPATGKQVSNKVLKDWMEQHK
ncbi:MAG: hypothetical protein EP344_13700 [Bacteroidetes bacterium]|nr:MAG: hypothetical protein EP344_13700 [Bacteroidota bacterium]